MSADLLKIAADLESYADKLDAEETSKVATEKQARKDSLKALADKYASVTGEQLSETELEKLSQSDTDVVRLLSGVVEKQAGTVDSLGAASERADRKTPLSVKEAAEQAEERFAAWAIS